MYRGRFSLLVVLLAASVCLGSQSTAWAGPIKAQRYSVKTPYSSIEAGAARIDIAANTQQISDIICDFGNYTKLSDKRLRQLHQTLGQVRQSEGGRAFRE